MNKTIARGFIALAVVPIVACGSSGNHATKTHSAAATSKPAPKPKPTPLSADGVSCKLVDKILGQIKTPGDILTVGLDNALNGMSQAGPIYAPAKAVYNDLITASVTDGMTDAAGRAEQKATLGRDEGALAQYCASAGYTMTSKPAA